MTKVIIMRGLPGSGKSFWISRRFFELAVVCSTDHYWIGPGFRYTFDKRYLCAAHDAYRNLPKHSWRPCGDP